MEDGPTDERFGPSEPNSGNQARDIGIQETQDSDGLEVGSQLNLPLIS